MRKMDANDMSFEMFSDLTKGELCSIISYLGLRTGLNRYINEPLVSRNLMQDTEFISADKIFKGKDKTTHHPPISP